MSAMKEQLRVYPDAVNKWVDAWVDHQHALDQGVTQHLRAMDLQIAEAFDVMVAMADALELVTAMNETELPIDVVSSVRSALERFKNIRLVGD